VDKRQVSHGTVVEKAQAGNPTPSLVEGVWTEQYQSRDDGMKYRLYRKWTQGEEKSKGKKFGKVDPVISNNVYKKKKEGK
jgi:hypothetical protein